MEQRCIRPSKDDLRSLAAMATLWPCNEDHDSSSTKRPDTPIWVI